MADKRKALFICLGNICRSPIAEAVFLKAIKDAGVNDQWEVDSAAIGGWHVGKKPDHRALSTMEKHNLPYDNRARQIKKADFENYDYIFGMDKENMSDLERLAPKGSKAKQLMLGDFDTETPGKIIRDPYYDQGADGFEQCYVQCVRCIAGFLGKIQSGQI
ncbi:low molecular weight phosphotyrosine protein phosphatase 1-like [Malaya genurostris]|uniref:low molecular weight phosphotyrosine protein phosphatase 1-like n=1 Tax=Malaya genurostris TaxID=325434 RepID=UPI0026F3DEDD|nr:low molecular weight phosphotyrosine protein phosphatase 1-like [Malaya genurostris]XP_058467344.1 low molecular weight phosphotyrosine protein phosphatase 1-like [Malaya genurostris]